MGLAVGGLPFVIATAPPAGATTSVSPGSVVVSDTTAGASTTYSVDFRTSSSGSLGPGATITFTAPSGTVFSSCTVACSGYTVKASSGSASVGSVSVGGPSVKISLALSTISGSDEVTVTIAGVTNPTLTSSGDSIQESTSADPASVSSANKYAITPGLVATVSVSSGNDQTAKTASAFHDPLVVLVQDRYGNAESDGVTVTFASPSCAGSPCATFSNGSDSEAVTAGADGTARSGPVTAGADAASYSVTASAGAKQASLALTTALGALVPGRVTLSPSSVEGTSPVMYTIPFTTSGTGAVPAGGTITLEAPPGSVLPASQTDYGLSASGTAVDIASVAVPTATQAIVTLAGTLGASAPVTVTVTGVTNPTTPGNSYAFFESTSADGGAASPAYTILPGPPSAISVVAGDTQTAALNQPFTHTLSVVIKDKDGNPVPGLGVTFSLPSAGASGTFLSGQLSDVVATDANGVATSTALTAGGTAGSYQASAGVAGSSLSATFHLQNVVSLLPGTVAVSAPQAGASADYTIPFTTSPSGSCQTSCSITLAAPGRTVLPTTTPNYSIGVSNGHAATVSGVSVSSDGSTAVIALSSSTIGAGDTVTVRIAGVGNPTSSAPDYVIRESTSSDPATVPSPAYAIVAAAPAVIEAVIGDSQSAMVYNTFASRLVASVADAYGNPVQGVPVTFTAPSSMGGAEFAPCAAGNPTLSQCIALTDSSGNALSSDLAAGGNGGVYQIVASAGAAQQAVFTLMVLQSGYWLVASDGGLFNHGGAPYDGSEGGSHLNKPIVGMAAAPDGGYYMVASDGGVFTFGGAPFHGSTGSMRLNAPVVGMAVDAATGGYWLVASDGGIFNFNAPFYGSEGGTHLNKPIVGMAATPEGGYYLVASDGGIFNFGPGATFYGSEGGRPINAPVVGMADAPGGGYYLVASDGGVFNFGPAAVFLGSASGASYAPVVGISIDPATGGYWIVASNGSVFNFGGAPFYGEESGHPLNKPVVAMAPSDGA